MECLGLHNKPKAEMQPGHKLTGTKEEEELMQNDKLHNEDTRTMKDARMLLLLLCRLLRDGKEYVGHSTLENEATMSL
jgi:hypothetical protein